MGESADNSNESDEFFEAEERFNEFGIGQDPNQLKSYLVDNKQRQNELASQNVAKGITTMSKQDFAREQDFFDANPNATVTDALFTSSSPRLDSELGAGYQGLRDSVINQIALGGEPVVNNGQIVGVMGNMRNAPVTGFLPAFMQNILPDNKVYTGISRFDPYGFTPDDNNNNEVVQPVTNQITGQTKCPDGYVFDEDLQACRLDTGTNKLSNTPINVSGTNVPTSGFFRGSLLDNAPMNTPSGFNFADANQKFVNQFVYDPSIYKNPMGLSGFTPFRRS